jgi:ABC-type phosphate transport system auxiliary subunit
MKLISKIADIDGEIQELVHESKLPVLNKLLDKSNDLYIERIAELEAKSEVLKYANEGLGFEIIELEKENTSLNDQNKRVCTEVAELEKELAHTENNLASLQSKFEDIEAVFCDEEGCLIVEPFNSKELSKWFKGNNLEQRIAGMEEVATQKCPVSGCPGDMWAVMIKQYESEALKEQGND